MRPDQETSFPDVSLHTLQQNGCDIRLILPLNAKQLHATSAILNFPFYELFDTLRVLLYMQNSPMWHQLRYIFLPKNSRDLVRVRAVRRSPLDNVHSSA